MEVISPNDLLYALEQKVEDYRSAGVKLIWVASPKSRSITAYRPKKKPTHFEAGDVLNGENVVPGFEVAVSEFVPTEAGHPLEIGTFTLADHYASGTFRPRRTRCSREGISLDAQFRPAASGHAYHAAADPHARRRDGRQGRAATSATCTAASRSSAKTSTSTST